MATRATYTFTMAPRELKKQVSFYIHYDGYPSGASTYFREMLGNLRLKMDGIDRELRGGPAEAFLRANKLAEITPDPMIHGDTEFHYVVENVGLYLQVTAYELDHERNLLKFFEGPVQEFIDRFALKVGALA